MCREVRSTTVPHPPATVHQRAEEIASSRERPTTNLRVNVPRQDLCFSDSCKSSKISCCNSNGKLVKSCWRQVIMPVQGTNPAANGCDNVSNWFRLHTQAHHNGEAGSYIMRLHRSRCSYSTEDNVHVPTERLHHPSDSYNAADTQGSLT